jgi:hypothetical protein
MTTKKINRDSLAAVYRNLIEGDIRPMDPVLVYDSGTGEFSIDSALTPKSETEHILGVQLVDTWLAAAASMCQSDIEDAIVELRETMIAKFVADGMAGMDDEYVAEYLIGDLDRDA